MFFCGCSSLICGNNVWWIDFKLKRAVNNDSELSASLRSAIGAGSSFIMETKSSIIVWAFELRFFSPFIDFVCLENFYFHIHWSQTLLCWTNTHCELWSSTCFFCFYWSRILHTLLITLTVLLLVFMNFFWCQLMIMCILYWCLVSGMQGKDHSVEMRIIKMYLFSVQMSDASFLISCVCVFVCVCVCVCVWPFPAKLFRQIECSFYIVSELHTLY